MEKVVYSFEDFWADVDPQYRDFVNTIHEALQKICKVKVESKANGFFVSYAHIKSKRSLLNFLFRKKGLMVRIYGDNIGKYGDFIDLLPEKMEKEIGKANLCRRLVNPEDCNPKCALGYDFSIRGKRYQKCRYNCFQFEVTPESVPVINEFLAQEQKARLIA